VTRGARSAFRTLAPERFARIVRRLRRAGDAYGASPARVAIRAAGLRRRGWRLGEAMTLGLLDPRAELASFDWAIRSAELEALQEALNPAGAADRAEDKRNLPRVCARHDLPCAVQIAVLERQDDAAATRAAWAAALVQAPARSVVVKPFDGHRGLGVRLLTLGPEGATDHRGRTVALPELADELAAERWGGYVVQERLRPHPELVRMSGHEIVQTLRLVTLRDDGAPLRLLAAAFRVADGSTPVDSFRTGATGNLSARVGTDGTLAEPLALRSSGYGLERIGRHPLSGAPLEGFRVPGWPEACALARRAAEAFAPLRAMGWDIAPTPDGPVLVEANAWWTFPSEPGGGPEPMVAALRAAVAALPPAARRSQRRRSKRES